jgi:hypothetical protein
MVVVVAIRLLSLHFHVGLPKAMVEAPEEV